MSFTLNDIFPGINGGLNQIGFIFGAGTSKDAGYPLMGDLTKSVVSNLSKANRDTLNTILVQKEIEYDEQQGTPNIEAISDLVIEFNVNAPSHKYQELEAEIKKSIATIILSVATPDLSDHIRFIEALKNRSHGIHSKVTIITTNYDTLFELAAAEVGVRLETGFEGSIRRFFQPSVFEVARGQNNGARFVPESSLQINLLKIHGSIAWTRSGDKIFESGSSLGCDNLERTMVLPRRRKVLETLEEPFDQLFARATRILGSECKYLASCGFSFGDKHINDQLLYPKLSNGRIKLTAFCGVKPREFESLNKLPSFQSGLPNECVINGSRRDEGTDLWRFSSLVDLITP